MDEMGNTAGVGLIIYSGSRDELQAKLRARDDRITEIERIARDWQQCVTDAETAIRLIVTKFENR